MMTICGEKNSYIPDLPLAIQTQYIILTLTAPLDALFSTRTGGKLRIEKCKDNAILSADLAERRTWR